MRGLLRTIRPIVLAMVFVTVSLVGISDPTAAYSAQEGVQAARGDGQPTELFGSGGIITTLTNTLLFVVGALSVIMIIVGGLRYIISGGNASAVSAAKNTVLYAIVGLIIAFLAFAAINWILGALTPGAGAGYTDV